MIIMEKMILFAFQFVLTFYGRCQTYFSLIMIDIILFRERKEETICCLIVLVKLHIVNVDNLLICIEV